MEKVYFQLFWKNSNTLFCGSKNIITILRAYEMAGDFKRDLEFHIVTEKNPYSI